VDVAVTAGLTGASSPASGTSAFLSDFLSDFFAVFFGFGATRRSKKPCLAGMTGITGSTMWIGSRGFSGASGTTARAFAAELSVRPVVPVLVGRTTPVPGRTTPVPGRT
jgi:hypothetical protein